VASKLLLSRGQVLGLEQGDASPFYNTDFFLRGLRKYMAFMGLPADLLVDDEPEEEGALRLMLADMAPDFGPRSRHQPGSRLAAVAGIAIVVAAAGTYIVSRTPAAATRPGDVVSLATTLPLPAEPIQLSLPVRAEPSLVSSGDSAATVRVSVGKATWVFVKYPDNRVVERRLEAGEQMDVPLPAYLAVGIADSVEVRVENRPVALGPFIRNGQVRLTQPDLARLVP
jgi:hypothetical protein